jgi:hypothetical protein
MARKQAEIPGTERERDEELDAAAADVYELTAERLAAHEREKLARTKLIETMQRKSVSEYLYEDGQERYQVTLTETERVSVRKAKEARRAAEAAE